MDFLKTPIKLYVHKLDSVELLIILGAIPKNVSDEINKMDSTKVKDSKILRSYFGANWKSKLGFETKGGARQVAAEYAADGTIEFNMDDLKDFDLGVEVGDAIVDANGIKTLTEIDSGTKAVKSVSIKNIKDEPQKKQKTYKPSRFLHFSVFPEDKISDFKYKINKYFSIPIFRQHIWYYINGKSVPLEYKLIQNEVTTTIDLLSSIEQGKEFISGIPIDMNLYRNKDFLKVEAFDNFSLMGNLLSDRNIHEFHIMDLDEFINPIRKELSQLVKSDKYQLNILYYSFILKFYPMMNIAAFGEFLQEGSLKSSYPALDPLPEELNYLTNQEELISDLYKIYETDLPKVTSIDQILQKSLTETTIKVNSDYKTKIVNFRVLFDVFKLDAKVDGVKLYDIYNGTHIVFNKTWDDEPPVQDKLIPNMMVFRIVISRNPYRKMYVQLFPNGTYHIKGSWSEDLMYQFKDVHHISDIWVTPFIKKINTQSGVFYSDAQLPIMNKSNIKFVDISLSLFWKNTLSTSEFKRLDGILEKFSNARIIQEKQIDHNVLSYYFKKGMYEIDPRRIEKISTLDNYYAYLFNSDIRQKWYVLFENIRVFTVHHRFSDVKIDITGIKEDEYSLYIRYIILIFYKYLNLDVLKTTTTETRETKLLSNLKEQDPKLYNFKKMYNSEIVYSKICQKPYQPLLLTKPQYEKLPSSSKSNVVEYWNFTTNTEAYYQCPNKKFPYIRFITGKHPLGYCIPCCKITKPPVRKTDKQRIIYDSCLKDHTFEKKQSLGETMSRYIITYGKSIDVGRISNLPESTMEPLFYDSKIEEKDPDDADADKCDEAIIEAKYYLYGTQQNHPQLSKIGYIYSLAHALEMTIEELIKTTIEKLLAKKQLFFLVLNGGMTKYFETVEDFTDQLKSLFLSTKSALPEISEFENWNEAFIDIAFYFLGVHSLVFEDSKSTIQLKLPHYISTVDDFEFPSYNHLIILHNLDTLYWNPVYVVHKDVYFRTGVIDKKLYAYSSDIIQIILDMVRYKFTTDPISNTINYDVMRTFITSSNYTLEKIMVTKDNLSYGVVVKGIGFIPIHMSSFKFDDAIPVSFESKDIKNYIPTIQNITKFYQQYNKWVLKESEKKGYLKADVSPNKSLEERVEPMYPLVRVEWWLIYKEKVLGFVSHHMHWYIDPLSVDQALRVAKEKIIRLYYDPFEVDALLELYPQRDNKPDPRTKYIDRALYNKYSYQLILLELSKYFSRQKNLNLRKKIKILITKHNTNKDVTHLLTQIDDTIFGEFDRNNNAIYDDVIHLKTYITDALLNGQSRSSVMASIDAESFNFDKIIFEKIKKLPQKDIALHLKKILDPMVHIGDPSSKGVFPNIVETCSTSSDNKNYCHNKKIIISKTNLNDYVDIIASQIKNPFIEKYLFSPTFITSVIDYFKFIKRPLETITIEYP